jgi:two-component system sensor histidine kinase KdpD
LLNAITYSPQGSKITIVGSKDIDKVYLSVLDEGPGIPPEDLNKIFEKFYRIPGTTISGTGLGLPLAKTIIELHGGTIEAFNRPEKGAELRICIKT